MNVFIVFANERVSSFNAALKDVAVQVFRERGDAIQVSDLYTMGFKAVADRQDFLSMSDVDCPYQVAQNKASEANLLSPDIQKEIEKLLWADLVIFHFPFWWFSMPAIMKGWIDRVIINGSLYSKGRWYSNGVLKGKKAFITITTGAPETAYSETGINGFIKELLFPIQHGMIHFLGMDAIDPFIVYGSPYISAEARKDKIDEYMKKLYCIQTAPLTVPANVALYDQETWKITSKNLTDDAVANEQKGGGIA